VISFLKKKPLPEIRFSDSGPIILLFTLQKYFKYFWTSKHDKEILGSDSKDGDSVK
jgi:hypothetical protein